MQKYDKQIKILAVLFLAAFILYFLYEVNGSSGTVTGYRHLIGLSLPNSSVSHNATLIQRINANEDANANVNILVKEAQDNVGQQLKDIIDLENHGIDLLIISPISDEMILEKLKELRIPVIVLHNHKAEEVASAFIEYDNLKAGELLASTIPFKDQEAENIVLISGNESESISIEREAGFLESLPKNRLLNVEKLYCEWKRNEAENQLKAYLVSGKKVDTVVAFSDQMAYGAYLGSKKLREDHVRFYGMDGFSGVNQGVDLLNRNIIQNTVKFEDMYEAMMKVALAILHGEEYVKETVLEATLVK